MEANDDDDEPTDPTGNRSEDTGGIHYPSFFVANFGIVIAKSGDAVAAHGAQLSAYPPARQRAILFGLDERLAQLESDIDTGRHLIRGFMDQLAAQPGKGAAETAPAPPASSSAWSRAARAIATWWGRLR
jgi:hypothetical protein